jgi:hypothetical protein
MSGWLVVVQRGEVKPAAPFFPFQGRPLKFYNRKLKDSRFSKMDDSLITESVSVISAPPVVPLGFGPSSLSSPSIMIGAQTLSEVSHDPANASVVFQKTPLMRGILRRAFLRPSSYVGARGYSSELVHSQPRMELLDMGGVDSSTVPASSLALAVRDVGEDGNFPFPLETFPPVTPLDWALFFVL